MQIDFVLLPMTAFPTITFDASFFLHDPFFDPHRVRRHNLNNSCWASLLDPELVGSYIDATCGPLRALYHRQRVLPALRQAQATLRARPDGTSLDPRWVHDLHSGLQAVCGLPGALGWSYFGLHYTDTSYDDRRSIEAKAAAGRDIVSFFLRDFVERDDIQRSDLVLLDLRSPGQIVPALALARLIKAHRKDCHVCIHNHEYESFSLRALITGGKAGWLLEHVDSIVVDCLRREETTMRLVERLLRQAPLAGVENLLVAQTAHLRLLAPFGRSAVEAQIPSRGAGGSRYYLPLERYEQIDEAQLRPPFQQRPVLITRVTQAPCAWRRCAFCAVNAKFYESEPCPDEEGEVTRFLQRSRELLRRGVRHYILEDENLSPALLRRLAERIAEEGLPLSWAARSNLTPAYLDGGLVAALHHGGCREILFGLESVSPRVWELMNKPHKHMTMEQIERIVSVFIEQRVGVHLGMMCGFPGETREELLAGVEQVRAWVRRSEWVAATYSRFSLLEETPIHADPARYGLEVDRAEHDGVSSARRYRSRASSDDAPSWREAEQQVQSLVDEFVPLRWMSPEGRMFQWFMTHYSCMGFLRKCDALERAHPI